VTKTKDLLAYIKALEDENSRLKEFSGTGAKSIDVLAFVLNRTDRAGTFLLSIHIPHASISITVDDTELMQFATKTSDALVTLSRAAEK